MDRLTFNLIGLAAVLAPLPQTAFPQSSTRIKPGYQVAEINDGRLVAGNGGMATAQSDVDNDTLFQVASCSKTVTALAVLTLVRDGRLDLDQPAGRYLRRWQLPGPRGATTTLADLLSHTAGTTVHSFGGYGPDEDLPTLLDILFGHDPANSRAVRTRRRMSRRFRYSGGGTMVLQAVLIVLAVRFSRRGQIATYQGCLRSGLSGLFGTD